MYNETYVKNTKRRGTMLDISYYEKTDEIIAQYTCEEKSLIPIIQGIQEEYRRNWESPRRKLTVWQAFMKIFLLRQKENM